MITKHAYGIALLFCCIWHILQGELRGRMPRKAHEDSPDLALTIVCYTSSRATDHEAMQRMHTQGPATPVVSAWSKILRFLYSTSATKSCMIFAGIWTDNHAYCAWGSVHSNFRLKQQQPKSLIRHTSNHMHTCLLGNIFMNNICAARKSLTGMQSCRRLPASMLLRRHVIKAAGTTACHVHYHESASCLPINQPANDLLQFVVASMTI